MSYKYMTRNGKYFAVPLGVIVKDKKYPRIVVLTRVNNRKNHGREIVRRYNNELTYMAKESGKQHELDIVKVCHGYISFVNFPERYKNEQ